MMKKLMMLYMLLLMLTCTNSKIEKQIVELSCGQCQLGLTSQKGCDLAVRIDGETYFVDGIGIDDFGDAHNKETGFCETIRKAEITGHIESERFKVESVYLFNQIK